MLHGFQDRRNRPLCHSSDYENVMPNNCS